jgi:hypothetical protein
MKEYKLLRYLRTALEMLTWISIVFLVAVFAVGAGIAQPPVVQVTGEGGMVTTYGIRMVLLLLFMIGGGLIGLLFVLARFPRFYRYPVEITAQNVQVQFTLAKILLNALQIICATYFSVLMIEVFRMNIILGSSEFFSLTLRCAVGAGLVYVIYVIAARRLK